MAQDRLTDLYKLIGERIYHERKKLELTQEEVAAKTGLTRPSIVHIERGEQRLPIDRLYRVARALNVSVFELLPAPSLVSSLEGSREELTVDSLSEQKVTQETQKKLFEMIGERRK